MAAAHELAGLLRGAGAEPTRAAVRDRLTRLSSAANPFLWPGIAVRTGRGDVQPLEAAVLRRWTTGGWRSFGGVWRHRGR
jgi:hypothetical protein